MRALVLLYNILCCYCVIIIMLSATISDGPPIHWRKRSCMCMNCSFFHIFLMFFFYILLDFLLVFFQGWLAPEEFLREVGWLVPGLVTPRHRWRSSVSFLSLFIWTRYVDLLDFRSNFRITHHQPFTNIVTI